MKKIEVSLNSKSYPIYIGCSLKKIGDLFRKYPAGEKILIITDENVSNLYSENISRSLISIGKKVDIFVIKPGEASKNFEVAYELLKKCSLFGMDRSDIIIALGGGVVCDLAGFVAAIYLRGIKFVSIPTTLLAQVDASIGGKTGINLPWGKNLIGVFHQPYFVVMDIQTLNTLPEREINQGMAEIIKTAVIRSKKLFTFLQKLEKSQLHRFFSRLVYECVLIKKRVVESDEKEEKGIREILNFGHTFGHAVEINSKNLNHGESVAVGMIGETYIAFKKGLCSQKLFKDIISLVEKYGLPTRSDVSASKLVDSIRYDKKAKGGRSRFVLPVRVGAVKTGVEVSPEEILLYWEKW
ncbi:MAG: 3-dehydroquinate synthase [Candidatus Omnitrophica bacterium]|nr:3-dehydroquinate synthase [Candidatus Omnitrophota bacterium]